MEINPHTWHCDMEAHGHHGNTDTWSGQSDINKLGYYADNSGIIDRTYDTSDNRHNNYPNHIINYQNLPYDSGIYNPHGHVVPVTSTRLTCDTLVQQQLVRGASSEVEHWHLQIMPQTEPFLMMPLHDGGGKRRRRRVISKDQRQAANVRERGRMYQLNDAFDGLRKRVPTFAYEKKLSRIETLNLAVTYIQFMGEMLNNDEKCEEMITKNIETQDADSSSANEDDIACLSEALSKTESSNESSNEEDFDDVLNDS